MTLAAEYTHSATTYLRQLKTPVPDKDIGQRAVSTVTTAQVPYHNLLEEIAGELVKRSLPQPYQIVSVHCPIQKDGDNCGLFICLFYWRRVFKEAGKDYSESGLLRRR
ncbi:hypothetical protein PC129_g699 [Phytophthora cactorum]|uniref:Ubiquitin-like protease family profile domain-containing protein n=1 Tax=Phytophthora cactorum TaxID=29920 RepID=A0A8T1EH06_9STRA|nr:hypothetical protein PC112_g2094 [Phytophthora cactorum]KAG2845788.1 hypothetical protein PC111_g1440 [Phytophthora cactorum]KAG2931036.1 hypothetical protein PC114_g2323 [Phytophthora cactorum]KAG2952961.1 hypothetical protein PC117_g2411 [Phytophthora cactorum]KAG3028591.1 hypothetical protein PC120_g4791 [Phytophthora cactorum]